MYEVHWSGFCKAFKTRAAAEKWMRALAVKGEIREVEQQEFITPPGEKEKLRKLIT